MGAGGGMKLPSMVSLHLLIADAADQDPLADGAHVDDVGTAAGRSHRCFPPMPLMDGPKELGGTILRGGDAPGKSPILGGEDVARLGLAATGRSAVEALAADPAYHGGPPPPSRMVLCPQPADAVCLAVRTHFPTFFLM